MRAQRPVGQVVEGFRSVRLLHEGSAHDRSLAHKHLNTKRQSRAALTSH